MTSIAWVDHSFHKKTKSSQFIIDILYKYGTKIDFFWDDSWNGGKSIDLSTLTDYDCIVLWQNLNKFNGNLRDIHKNITFFPMLDSYGLTRGGYIAPYFWKKLRGVKIINFSRMLHYICLANNLESRYFQFFLPPKERNIINGLHGFFWYRRPNEISWNKIKKLIQLYRFDSFHIHFVPDFTSHICDIPSEEDIKLHNISISTAWFDDKEKLDRIRAEKNIFFAPRLEEGIGLAMLEAFSSGMCIVSPNAPTMNEYIIDNVNGKLYEINNIHSLNFNNLQQICDMSFETANYGFSKWKSQHEQIFEYIINPFKYFSDIPKIASKLRSRMRT